jgi:hypothetical protein
MVGRRLIPTVKIDGKLCAARRTVVHPAAQTLVQIDAIAAGQLVAGDGLRAFAPCRVAGRQDMAGTAADVRAASTPAEARDMLGMAALGSAQHIESRLKVA